jgi:hypothetical protein
MSLDYALRTQTTPEWDAYFKQATRGIPVGSLSTFKQYYNQMVNAGYFSGTLDEFLAAELAQRGGGAAGAGEPLPYSPPTPDYQPPQPPPQPPPGYQPPISTLPPGYPGGPLPPPEGGSLPPPPNPWQPGGPQPGQPPQQQPNQFGPFSAWGYGQGPNGELLPVMLNQGRSPFQMDPQPGLLGPQRPDGLLGPDRGLPPTEPPGLLNPPGGLPPTDPNAPPPGPQPPPGYQPPDYMPDPNAPYTGPGPYPPPPGGLPPTEPQPPPGQFPPYYYPPYFDPNNPYPILTP